ncbi:MAG: hypothetical protein QF360_08370 [Phycisphaerales bacterium]|nr:hypothetical protein [Phycisphaerales bacterium]
MLLSTSILAASALAVSDGPWPATPIRHDLSAIAQRIVQEDCRLTIIGDSNSIRETSPRMLGGIMRTWRPNRWVGRVAPAAASSNEGIRTLTSDTGLLYTTRRVFNIAENDPEVWSNGQDGFVPTRGWDIMTDGSGLSGSTSYTFTELTRMDDYIDGDWVSDHPMRARLVFARDPSGMPPLTYRAHRGGVTGESVSFSPQDPDAQRAWIDWVEVDVPAGSGVVGGEVRPPAGWLHEAGGGPFPCPENCQAGQTFYHITQVLWRSDASGLQIDAIAEAGFRAFDHLAEGGQYDDEALRRYLAATREPNLFLVLLGQNMTEAELNDIEGIWRSHVEGVIERYRAASLANDPQADPLFLLVSPWHASDTTDRYVRMAETLHQIAQARMDSGFINLFALAGSYELNRGIHLEHNGVHFSSESGADYFNSLIWNQIEREFAGHVDLLLPGDLDELAGIVLGSDVSVHVMPGIHAGGVTIGGEDVLIRGWAPASSVLGAPALGGSTIVVDGGATLQLERMRVIGGEGTAGDDGQTRGGAIAINMGEARLFDGVIEGGDTDLGGCVSADGGLLEMTGMHVQSGQAAVMGGLMYAIDSGVRLEGSDFVDGASAIGGGLSIQGGTLDMANVTVVDCVAVGQGGGLFIADATANLAAASVRRCEAADGGGLWAQGGGVDVTNSRFQHNDAGNSGGGIVSVDEAVSLLSTEVCGNSPEQVFGTFVDLGENVIQAQCPCESDFDGNGEVDINDLLVVVSSWGACEPGCVGDTNGDDIVDTDDLLTVISAWGVCL